MAYYNMQGPAQYQQHQQSRKDQQMNQMLQMMMQMQAFKQRKGQWEEGREFKQEQFEFQKQKQEATEKYHEYQMKPKPPTPTGMMQTIDWMVKTGMAKDRLAAHDLYKGFKTPERIEVEAAAATRGRVSETPPKAPKPTRYDKQVTRAQGLLDEGKISQETFDRKVAGLKAKPTKAELIAKGLPIRTANETFVKSTFTDVRKMGIVETAKGQVKDAPGAVPTVDGVRIDMPFAYGVAVKNIADGKGNIGDRDIIRSYDMMLDLVRNEIIPAWGGGLGNYRKFQRANPPGTMEKHWEKMEPEERPTIKFDYNQAKLWFKIYK